MATATTPTPTPTAIDKDETLANLPPQWPDDESLASSIAARVRSGEETVVVLDDDPTGTQTVYDLPVLTRWTQSILDAEFAAGTPAFYVLTNSRGMGPEEAARVNGEIASRLLVAAGAHGRRLCVISRSDSTLRGHYPLEIDVLARTLRGADGGAPAGRPIDGQILVPFFLEGGRYTINDVHYVAEGSRLVPAADTPFAKDQAFGFSTSNLREYVEEKTGGEIKTKDVISISIDDLRRGGPERVRGKLSELSDMRACVVNAASLRDVQVLVMGMLESEERDGKRFLVRSAASFVQARLGLPKRPILSADVINHDDDEGGGGKRGGLVVVGSYVPKTTAQLEALMALGGIEGIELDVSTLVDPEKRTALVRSTVERVEAAVRSGRTAVVHTSRTLVEGSTPADGLAIGNAVSDGLVSVVSDLSTRPRFLVAKGGITSSDVATKGLSIRRAVVLGQAAPGVPVWRVGDEGRFPGMSYVVFPGNVGADDELARLVSRLSDG